MSHDAKINLRTHLKAQNQNELQSLAEIALKVGNTLLFETVSEADPKIGQKTSKLFQNDNLFFEICKSGTAFSYSKFINNRQNNQIFDENNNSCMHIAAKFGNVDVENIFTLWN